MQIPSTNMARQMLDGYCFLQEDPDKLEPEGLYRSSFVIELIASTHLTDIAWYANIPRWDTKALAASKSGGGVIALAATAVRSILSYFSSTHYSNFN